MNICDFHLSKASDDFAVDQRGLGNRILAAQRQAAEEWTPLIEAFLPRREDLAALPDGSWLLDIHFRLARPFASKAEGEFRPWEQRVVDRKKGTTKWFESQNPIVRDHLTGLPIIRPTTWKGNLRFAARAEELEDGVRGRLFGMTRGEAGQAGRLHFFPTFFPDKAGREVVTPLWRDTRTPARGPIDFEIIQAGCEARFNLLYVPRPRGTGWHSRQVADDLEVAAHAVKAMLLEFGFSAKKTSGWGVAEDTLASGALIARGSLWPVLETAGIPFVEPEREFLDFIEDTGDPKAGLRKASGEWLSNQEYKASGAEKSLSQYREFRTWHKAYGAAWIRHLADRGKITASVQAHSFCRISDFPALAEKLANGLREAAGA